MKVQVNLSDDMVSAVDAYAKKMGVSRSAFCSIMIGQSVFGLNRAVDAATDAISKRGIDASREDVLDAALDPDNFN